MTQPLSQTGTFDSLAPSAAGSSSGSMPDTASQPDAAPVPRSVPNAPQPLSPFVARHIGPTDRAADQMLKTLGYATLDALIEATIPAGIRLHQDLELQGGLSEHDALARLRQIADKNQVWRSYIGLGYANTLTPPVIQRNVLENPGWYTQYTPYQPEIAQGRLQALLNFQTMVTDLTAMEIANASLLDEGTAAAEAMTMAFNLCKRKGANVFWVSEGCHPQTIAVVKTRALPLGIEIVVGNHPRWTLSNPSLARCCNTPPRMARFTTIRTFIAACPRGRRPGHRGGRPAQPDPAEAPRRIWGRHCCRQHPAVWGAPGLWWPPCGLLCNPQCLCPQAARSPGRRFQRPYGKPALRLALQTREQHIRRDAATSNICTAQVLLAIIASMYAVYHGPDGLRHIATRIHQPDPNPG
jgi:glycine dehydrogenase